MIKTAENWYKMVMMVMMMTMMVMMMMMMIIMMTMVMMMIMIMMMMMNADDAGVEDDAGDSILTQFSVTVESVNDAPELGVIGMQTVDEDSML